MLKQAVYAATGVAQRVKTRHGNKDQTFMPDLVRAVMRRNPQFQKLDALLAGLARVYQEATEDKGTQAVGVCSAADSEGKTMTALALAATLAIRGGDQVLFVEADLRGPTLARDFQLSTGPGLADYLRGEASCEDVCQRTSLEQLSVVTAGNISDSPIELVTKARLQELMGCFRSRYRHIVIDIPAVLEYAEAGRLLEAVDQVILVIAAGRVSRSVCTMAVATIGRDKLLGVVLNRAHISAPLWLNRILSPVR